MEVSNAFLIRFICAQLAFLNGVNHVAVILHMWPLISPNARARIYERAYCAGFVVSVYLIRKGLE